MRNIGPKRTIKGGAILSAMLMAFVFSIVLVSAQSVTIKTVPEKSTWKADGETVYRLDVVADSTNLQDLGTIGVDWTLNGQSYLNVVDMRVPNPGEPDFFEGSITTDQIHYGGTNSARAIFSESFPGPIESQGILGSYWFTVDPSAVKETTSFTLTAVEFIDSNWNSQPALIENEPIRIVSTLGGGSCIGSRACSTFIGSFEDGDGDLSSGLFGFSEFSFLYSLLL